MSTDISAIMQLLQRQMTIVPPDYSTVSSPLQASLYIGSSPDHEESLIHTVTPLESERLSSLSQLHICPDVKTKVKSHIECMCTP